MTSTVPPPGEQPEPRPTRRPFDALMWREVLSCLLNFPYAVAGFVYIVPMISLGAALSVTMIGLPVLAGALAGSRGFGSMERTRTRNFLGEDVGAPQPIVGKRPGTVAWLVAALSDGNAWRTVLYLLIRFPWGIVTFVVTLVLLCVGWPVLPWVVRGMAWVDRNMARIFLAPSHLEERVQTLESDRGRVADTAAADLRRIERDLHDGAQARLVNLAMGLGMARDKVTEDPGYAERLLEEAHGEAKLAVRELRDLARGIHPAILTDRGLDAALSHLAGRMRIPVTVTADLNARPDGAIEGTAYFAASELLTNVTKHAQARSAAVDVWRDGERLLLQVRDDGHGGAHESKGSGIAGLADRIRAVDGVFALDSPDGGPTAVSVELPWRTTRQS